jgi:hypothetical protein
MDDWACVLPQLKQLFHNWQASVLGYHQENHPGINIPKVNQIIYQVDLSSHDYFFFTFEK